MPYKKDSPPDVIKGLPAKAQSIWIEAFNSAFADSQDDAKSSKIAWGAVKNQYEKNADGEWVKKEATESIEMNVSLMSDGSIFESRPMLEADDRRTVWVRIVKPGWSYNGNYWTKEAVAQMPDRIMESGCRKMYLDHEEGNRKFGRSMRDWVAQAIEAKMVNGIPYVKAEILHNVGGDALWEQIQKFPDEVGASVDARVKIKNGVQEGRSGRVVTEVVRLNSLDFVNEASAGGGVDMRVAASKMSKDVADAVEKLVGETILTFEAAATTLKDQLSNEDQKRKVWDLWSALQSVLRNIVSASEDEMSDDDKKAAAVEVFKEFIAEIEKLDLVAFESRKEKGDMAGFTTLSEFKSTQPELYDAFMKEALVSQERSTELTEAKSKISELETRLKTIEADLKSVSEAKEAAETEAKALKDEKAALQLAESRRAMIDAAKIPADLISEAFVSAVKEAKTEEAAKALVADRVAIAESVAKTKPSGFEPKPKDGVPIKEGAAGFDANSIIDKYVPAAK